MLKIAICDDEIKITSLIEETVQKIFAGLKTEISIEIFYSIEKILSLIESEKNYDLIFLDIEFKKENGIYLADYLRKNRNDYNTEIVFISGKNGYEKKMFDVQPLNFIKKPFTYQDIKKVVDTFLKKRTGGKSRFQYTKGKNEIILLDESDILYFESVNRKIRVVTVKGEDEFYGCLENLEEKLKGCEFIRVHRSYIVNLSYANTVRHNLVIMSNEDAVPVGRNYARKLGENERAKSDSGNKYIDDIVNFYIRKIPKDVKLHLEIKVPCDLDINERDFSVIIGNLTDNSIEALSKVKNNDKFISIGIVYSKNIIAISIRNSSSNEIKRDGDSIISTKRGCGRFLGQPMQPIQEIACTPQGSNTLTIS